MSTSTEGRKPSDLSSLPEHPGWRHRLVPADRAEDIGDWKCAQSPPCGLGFGAPEAAQLVRDGLAYYYGGGPDTKHTGWHLLAPAPRADDIGEWMCLRLPDCGMGWSSKEAVALVEKGEARFERFGYSQRAYRALTPEPEEPAPSEAILEVARRLPVAVAYATTGGHVFEVVTPGDAVVSAIDGKLVIEHHGLAVLGIVRTMPWPPPAAEGEPDGPGTEDPEG